jgi:3-oxoadipate enol-lactonase
MTRVRVNGAELYLEDTGGDGPPILFMHGLMWSTRMFAPQIARLRDRYRCIAFDHRGQGESGPDPAKVVSMETCYQDAVAVMDALGLKRCHLVGLSMGGFVAMRIAARQPDRVDRLVLLETSADPEPRENMLKYRILIGLVRVLGVRPLVGTAMKILFGRTFMTDPARARDRQIWAAELARNTKAMINCVRGVIERDGIYDEIHRIQAPTLVIVGDEDTATVPAKAERIAAKVPGAELVRVPRAGHTSTIEAPEVVTAAIERFLSPLPHPAT